MTNWNPDLPGIQEFKSGLASQLIRSCLCIFHISRFYVKIWLQPFFVAQFHQGIRKSNVVIALRTKIYS